jgi:hypothetical protein
MSNSAVFSDCGKYRYLLTRDLNVSGQVKKCLFIMLNPSTADASKNDPTVRRCISFAARESCTHLTVCNLFAARSTDPKQLELMEDPTGPLNLDHISRALDSHDLIIVAFGAHKMASRSRAWQMIKEHGKFRKSLYFLGKTKSGAPRHPLYVKKDQPLELF